MTENQNQQWLTITPGEVSQPELHGYLLSAVAPRPIAFASTIDKDGRVNLSPFSFFNVFSSNPPVLIFSPARSGRDNTTKNTYDNVKEVAECVVSIVNYPIVEQMSLASTAYPKGVNEFVKAGFTEIASDLVKPPRVGEAPVSLECKVMEVKELGNQGGAGNLIICEVLKVHIRKEYLDDNGQLDTTKLNLVGRMGGSWYVKAFGEALFEIPKPLTTLGIGIDQLPEHARTSTTLTGNELARLGNMENVPNSEELSAWRSKVQDELSSENIDDLHLLVRKYLSEGDTESALKTVFLQ